MTTDMDVPVSLTWAPTGPDAWELLGRGRHARLERADRAWVAYGPAAVWALQTVGFHHPRVVVRPRGVLAEVAHFQPDWRGCGTIVFADGTPFEVEHAPDGGGLTIRATPRLGHDCRAVARLRLDDRPGSPGARITLTADVAFGPHGLLLAVIGWHRLLDTLADPSRPRSRGTRGGSVRDRFA